MLVKQVSEEAYPQGAVVLAEGAAADRLFLIAEGEVLVSTANGGQQVPLCRLSEGELFGEIGLLDPLRQRSARVTVVRPLLVATLAARHFQALVLAHPEARQSLEAAAEAALVASLLKRASPFRRLGGEPLRWLAARLEAREFPAGATIFQEGDREDVCYLVRSGKVEVLKRDGGSEKSVAALSTGDIVGEATLLTDAPRDASLRALEDARLLALRRSDLLHVLESEKTLGREVVSLAQQRDRPVRIGGVAFRSRATPEGASITVLEDPSRPGTYEQLSAAGLFVWEQLDGRHTLEEIAAKCGQRCAGVAPQEVAAIVARLIAAGFARAKELRPDVAEALRPQGLWERVRRLFKNG